MITASSFIKHFAMRDRCTIATYSAGSQTRTTLYAERSDAAYGDYGSEIRCGVALGKSSEVVDGSEATLTDGEIQLPLGTAVTNLDRIKVTKMHYENVLNTLGTPVVYAVIGAPRQDDAAVVCAVRRVTGNSEL